MSDARDGGGASSGDACKLPHALNPEQERAASHVDGPLLVLAGAGSGKTRVLVHRIARLVNEAGVPPWRILAITFTNKAAREMKQRVERMLPEAASSLWISTFHAACARMLRRDIGRLGYSASFSVADASDQLSLVKQCIKELNISESLVPPRAALDAIGRAKDVLIDPQRYAREAGGDFRLSKIASVYALYQDKLKKSDTLDFDDIVCLAVKLLREHADVREYYQDRFVHVLVDEYQDTNAAQYELVMLLCAKWRNLCVVGDDDQSIYGWRGADIGNILGFEKDFGDAKVVKLEQNYRSTKRILDAANAVITKNRSRKRKSLWTGNEDGARILLAQAANEHEEAGFIARGVSELRAAKGFGWGDCAVLYRVNAQSRAIENAFIREGIPYRIVGGLKFFDRKEIKDIVSYMRLIANPRDDISFLRAVSTPRRGIGDATLARLADEASELGVSLFEAASAATADSRKASARQLAGFVSMIGGLAAEAPSTGLDELLDRILDRSGIARSYRAEGTEEAMARLENILEFKTEIIEFVEGFQGDGDFFAEPSDGAIVRPGAPHGAPGLAEFLMHISLVSDIDNMEESDERVSVMTVHSAKGLEFKAVFLAGAEEGVFPGVRALSSPNQLEEERRLCYVAITRARSLLCITNAESRTLFGSTSYNMRSRFVRDIPEDLAEQADARVFSWDVYMRGGGVGGASISRGGAERGVAAVATAEPSGCGRPAGFGASARLAGSARSGASARLAGPARSGASARAFSGSGLTQAVALGPGRFAPKGMSYSVGDKVEHKKYGAGVVTSRHLDAGDYIIEVEFGEAGMKRFIEAMVGLRKL